jgi:hypothetical protein
MVKDLVIIFIGIALSIGSIVFIAYLLQQWFFARSFSSNYQQLPQKDFQPQNPELSEKIKTNSGVNLPTYEIDTLLPVQNNEDSIILVNYRNWKGFRNILRCHPDGSIVWLVELPDLSSWGGMLKLFSDYYIHIEWNNQGLRACSASGFNVILDVETGKVISATFTK